MKRNLLDGLIAVTNREVTFTVDQFRGYRNGEVSLSEVYLCNKLDTEVESLNPRLHKMLITAFATTLFMLGRGVMANAAPMDVIFDDLGAIILSMFQSVGYWIAIILCLKDMYQAMLKGGKNTEEIFGIITRYTIIFAAMFFIPVLFREIRKAFSFI